MNKNKKSTKQRRADAKRGLKKSARKKASKADKYIREEKRKKTLQFKNRKLRELIDKLAGANGDVQEQPEA